jgi:hypothetical protein
MNRMPAVTVERTALACASCEVREVMMDVSAFGRLGSCRLFGSTLKPTRLRRNPHCCI